MKRNLIFAKLFNLLLVFGFLVSFQSNAQAQLTIENATDCTLYVAATQLESNTVAPCDACNLVALRRVLPSASITIPANLACGVEYWKEVFYTTAPSGAHVATTVNPSNLCGNDVGMITCNSTVVEATWSQTGAGSGTVTLK